MGLHRSNAEAGRKTNSYVAAMHRRRVSLTNFEQSLSWPTNSEWPSQMGSGSHQ